MGIICNNCKAPLGCSCQKKTASNGASVCANCIGTYEAQLKGLKAVKPHNALSNTKPTGVHVLYNGPGKQS
jgi:hypothetical protein